MARADIHTLLSLDRYARIMGINPAHFNSGSGATVMPADGTCDDFWFQYAWQKGDRASRDELAQAIADAEREIAQVLGYWPAPKFIEKEMHQYRRHHRPDVWGTGVNSQALTKGLRTKWGKFILGGQRKVTLIDTATVAGGELVLSDDDGDGFTETATVTVATTETSPRDLKCYFVDKSGAQAWEIRPPRSKRIAGGNVIFTFWVWQLIDPDLWEALPQSGGVSGVNLDDSASFVTSVEVYKEEVDHTEESVQFFWEPEVEVLTGIICSSCQGAGCPICSLTVQDGCVYPRNVVTGEVVANTGTYDADEGTWVKSTAAVCREPDQIKLWYYAGDLSDEYLAGSSYDPLSDHYAQAIAWLATARLSRPPCGCGSTNERFEYLRRDLSKIDEVSYTTVFQTLDNPFGSRRGEVMAWKRIFNKKEKVPSVAVM